MLEVRKVGRENEAEDERIPKKLRNILDHLILEIKAEVEEGPDIDPREHDSQATTNSEKEGE